MSAGSFDVAVKGSQLFSDYSDNEVAADNKYKGKILIVEGDVAAIKKDALGDVVVELTTSNEFMSVDAHMASQANMATLKKGQTVGLFCEGDGMLIGSPQLKDCELAETLTGGAW